MKNPREVNQATKHQNMTREKTKENKLTVQLATDVASQTKSSHHKFGKLQRTRGFSCLPPARQRYISGGGFQPTYTPPLGDMPTVRTEQGSSPDFARGADSHPACPLSLISSSRVRFQSQGCPLSSSLYGSQGRTHGTPQRG